VEVLEMDDANEQFSRVQKEPYQIHGQFIISHIKSGFLLIDQQAASERILYEKYLDALENQPIAIQKLLFPKTLELSPADAALLRDILDDVNTLGFEIALFGGNAFVVHGVPADLDQQIPEEVLIGNLLDQYRNNIQMELNERKRLAAALARNTAVKRGRLLTVNEMRELIDQLFACSVPFACPSGKKCFIQHDLEEIRKQFG
jgi:DNA mismatch repair protein MutL